MAKTAIHAHAHYFPLSLTSPRHIDHVLLYAPGGFSVEAVRAVSQIRWAFSKGIRRLSVNLVGAGQVVDLYRQLSSNAAVKAGAADLLKPARVFTSVTPLAIMSSRWSVWTGDGASSAEPLI